MSGSTARTCRKFATGSGHTTGMFPARVSGQRLPRTLGLQSEISIMSNAVLVLNAGSSSIKFGLFDISRTEPDLLCKGLLDERDAKRRLTVTDPSGNDLFEKHRAADDNDEAALLADIFDWINDYLAGGSLLAVGHRVVHGGRDFVVPVEVSEAILEALAALTPLAPLHQ